MISLTQYRQSRLESKTITHQSFKASNNAPTTRIQHRIETISAIVSDGYQMDELLLEDIRVAEDDLLHL
jgi:hypothetical protein